MKQFLLTIVIWTGLFFTGTQAQVTLLNESFEGNTIPLGWTVIDADGDGHQWEHNSVQDDINQGHTGDGAAVSYSKDLNTYNPLTPDNWLVTPAIPLIGNSTLTFWRMVGYFSYDEHYGVYISTTSATDPSTFTLLYEETPTQSTYAWTQRTVNLDNYTGSTVYIAFRHFNCTNKMLIALDDILVTCASSGPVITASPNIIQFPNVPVGQSSLSKPVVVQAFNTTGAITATVTAPFEVSLNDTLFTNSVTLTPASQTLYVRYTPAFEGSDSAAMTISNGSVSASVTLLGSGINCGSVSLPYTENFNDLLEFEFPDCWYKINPYEGYPLTTNDYSADNTLLFKCDHLNAQPVYAVMPLMPDFLTNLQITFTTFRDSYNSGTFSMGYVTDPYDGSTFVPVWSINASQIGDNNPHTYLVSFENENIDLSYDYYIAFKYVATHGSYWLLDDIVVEEIPACPPPTNLVVNTVTSTSATVNWSGSPTLYNVYYKTAADTAWAVMEGVSPDSLGYTIGGLLPNTTYEWYVASVCDDGTTVNSLSNSTFTTPCSIYGTPFVEDFNGGTTLPSCWGRYSGLASDVFSGSALSNTSAGWGFQNTQVFGSNHTKVNIYGSSCHYWLVTPAIDLTGLANPALIFDLALTDFNSSSPIPNPAAQNDDKFMVIVSTDHGATWSAANATVWSNDGNGNYVFNQIPANEQEVTIPLSNYLNETVMIAFYAESTVSGNGDNDLHIDNVTVCQATNCSKPTNLSVANISPQTADLNWSGTADSYLVEYKALTDTVWSQVNTTDTLASLSGLIPCTTYKVKVYGICSGGTSLAATITFTTDMEPTTIPYYTDFSAGSDQVWVTDNSTCVNQWVIGETGENTGGLFISSNGTTPGYNTGSRSVVSAEKLFTVGDVEELSISFDVKVGGETDFDYLKVFFAPADSTYPGTSTGATYPIYSGEDFSTHAVNFSDFMTYSEFPASPYKFNLTGNNTVHVTVTMPNPNSVPNAASIAKLVFVWKNDNNGGTQPGAIIYNVSVEALSCPAPTGLTVSNLTSTSANVSWTANGDETSWALKYKEIGDTSWTTFDVFGTPAFTLTGLSVGGSYQVCVQAVCGTDDTSLWECAEFHTPCDAITTFPYTEGFENGGMPDCWAQEHVTGLANWTFQAGNHANGAIADAHEGSFNAYFFENSSASSTTRLVSPIFDLSHVSAPYLTYWYAQQAWGNSQDHLTVFYRTSPTSGWQMLMPHGSSVSVWTMDSVALPEPSATYQIAFVGEANYGYGIILDDITINGEIDTTTVPETCEAPTNLRESGVIFDKSPGLLDVVWDNPSGASHWNLQYRLADESAWNTVTVNETHYMINNLEGGLTYVLRVQAICDNGVLSDWSNTLTAVAQSVGIESGMANIVTLFPNPANDIVNVQCSINNVHVTAMEVFDVYGKRVAVGSVNQDSSLQTSQINVSSLSDGLYFVRVTTDQGTVTKTFVKR